MLGVVVQIDGFDPVAGAAVALRAGSHDRVDVCHLGGGDPWWPALLKLPTLRYDLFDGAFSGQIEAPSSSLKLAAEPWPDFGRYTLADARLRLWTGEVGQPWNAWTLRFDGRITEQPELADGAAQISFAVDDRWLDQALLSLYAGTTGAEGDAALKGQPKPLALGAPRYVAGTLVDQVNSVFQVSGYGPVQAFEAALEKLARYGAPVANYADYASLVAATIPTGTWATARAVGMARFGAPPTGQISFLVSGDAGGPNGWAHRPGQLIRRLALLSGGAGRIHDASLDALDLARPYNVSLYLDQQTTARQLIQQLAASVNAVAGMSWTGQLFAVPVAIGAPTLTLAADGSALPPVTSVKQIGIAAPFRKLAITAERCWTVHALADIAFTATLVDMGAYDAATVYREGNIVALPDGSRWLYAASAASSGNPPEVGSGYWSPLSSASNPTYADGTPIDDLRPAVPGATRNDDAGNMIPTPVDLAGAVCEHGASIQHVVGGGPRIGDAYRALLVGEQFSQARWCGPGVIPVSPGERLFYRHQVKCDVDNTDSARGGFRVWRSDGSMIDDFDLPGSAVDAHSCVGTWRTCQDSLVVPADAASIAPYVVRPSWNGVGTFFVGEPFLGRAQPGADVTGENTAKDTKAVGGRSTAALLQQFDVNSTGLLEQTLRTDDFVAVMDARTLVNGQAVGPVFLTFRNSQTGINSGFNTNFQLLGQKTADETGWVLDLDTVMVDDSGKSLATKLSEVGIDNGTISAHVQQLMEAVINADGSGLGRFVLRADAQGRLVGVTGTVTGETSELTFAANSVYFVDPNGSTAIAPFRIVDSKVRATDFEADTITYGALVDKFAGAGQQLLDPNGYYQKVPGGLIIQGGRYRQTITREVALSVPFPTPFPNQCLSAVVTPHLNAYSSARDLWLQTLGEPTTQGFSVQSQAATSDNMTLDGFDWIAFGR